MDETDIRRTNSHGLLAPVPPSRPRAKRYRKKISDHPARDAEYALECAAYQCPSSTPIIEPSA